MKGPMKRSVKPACTNYCRVDQKHVTVLSVAMGISDCVCTPKITCIKFQGFNEMQYIGHTIVCL
jgi:hypothetical protein